MSEQEQKFDWVVRLDKGYAVSAHRREVQVSQEIDDAMRCTEAGAKHMLGMLQVYTKQRGRVCRYSLDLTWMTTP